MPNSKSGKQDCIVYLQQNDVQFDPKSERPVLWKLVQAHIKEHKKSERLERGRKKPGPKSKAGIVTETFYFVRYILGKIPCTHTF